MQSARGSQPVFQNEHLRGVPVEMNVLLSQPKASQSGMVDAMTFGNTMKQLLAPPRLGAGEVYLGGQR